MSLPYTCLSCRLQQVAGSVSRSTLKQKRWASRSVQLKQGLQGGYPSQAANAEILKRRNRRSGQEDQQTGPDVARGRYSGRPLAPEHLLQDLQQSQNDERLTQPRGQLSARSAEVRDEDADISERADHTGPKLELPRPLFRLRGKLLEAHKSPAQDDDFWTSVQDIMKVYRFRGEARAFFDENHVRRLFDHSIARMVDRWKDTTFHSRTDRVPNRRTDDVRSQQAVTPSQALKHRLYFDLYQGRLFQRMLWTVALRTAEYDAARAPHSGPPNLPLQKGLNELMRLWYIAMAVNRYGQLSTRGSEGLAKLNSILGGSLLDWSYLPDPLAFVDTLRAGAHDRNTRSHFGSIVNMLVMSGPRHSNDPRLSPEALDADLESSAIVTLGLLQMVQARPGGHQLVKAYEPWMRVVELSLKNVSAPRVPEALAGRMAKLNTENPRSKYFQSIVQKLNLDTESAAVKDPTSKPRDEENSSNTEAETSLPEPVDPIREDLIQASQPTNKSSEWDRFTYLCIKRLGRAVEENNLRAAETVRQDATNFKLRNPGSAVPQALHEHMIYSFLRLRSIRTTVQLWNDMVEEGHEPRLKTYTTMMRGSLPLKDLTALDYFWNKMKEANIQPDAIAWSTRINGLMTKGHTDAGIAALAEMGRDWLLAAKQAYINEQQTNQKRNKAAPTVTAAQLLARHEGDVGGVPRPNIVVMNTAVNPLSRGKDTLIPKVLAWGRSFGIEPDLYTYNSLLHVCMRRDNSEEALKLLQQMRDKNIQTDSNTWTIILTDMFVGGFLDGLDPNEQETKVFSFLSSIEGNGSAGLDNKGYALLLDRLLKNYENHGAAQAVLSHMTSKGIHPSPQIYTILMSSHLQQSPPNFFAAESLWEHIQSAKGGYGANLDSKFYNLAIKGYAPHHAVIGTEKILAFLARMEDEGKQPSWSALEATARALADTGQWARLAQIVDRTRRRLKEAKGVDSERGQWDFWQFVISTGLLSNERISSPEQIIGTAAR